MTDYLIAYLSGASVTLIGIGWAHRDDSGAWDFPNLLVVAALWPVVWLVILGDVIGALLAGRR